MTKHNATTITRRRIIQGGAAAIGAMAAGGRVSAWAAADEATAGNAKVIHQIGLLTDVHHADKPTRGSRHYRDSLPKLNVALKTFVEQKVDAIIQLGDLIDAHETVPAEEKSLREVAALLHKTDIPSHFVMGNHCLALLSKQRFAELAGCRDSHYHFDVGPMRFIVLDANYTKDGAAYNAGNFKWTDCFISEPQLEWLGETLSASRGPTIVTTHQRLDPDRHHTVANHEAVRKVIAEAGGDRVKAVFQGHSHRNLRVELNEVPYIVLAGVIEGAGLENNAYGILQLHEDGTLQLKGFGKQADYAL